jgi:hypothetical protein
MLTASTFTGKACMAAAGGASFLHPTGAIAANNRSDSDTLLRKIASQNLDIKAFLSLLNVEIFGAACRHASFEISLFDGISCQKSQFISRLLFPTIP